MCDIVFSNRTTALTQSNDISYAAVSSLESNSSDIIRFKVIVNSSTEVVGCVSSSSDYTSVSKLFRYPSTMMDN